MKKTALTMTDSEKSGAESVRDHPDTHPKTPEEENRELRMLLEQQDIAMDMIMRKYRDHVDSLTKVSHFDVRTLYYKRFLDTIVSQANKMDGMTKTMRKNLLIIFKYEEVMRELESENEDLRSLVSELTQKLASTVAEKSDVKKPLSKDVESQTLNEKTVSTVDKSVGTSSVELENLVENGAPTPEKQDECTDMIPYTPFSDRFVYFGTVHTARPPIQTLDVDSAFDLYVNRLSEETKKPSLESASLPNVTSTEAEEDSSEVEVCAEESSDALASSTRAVLLEDVDEISSENSIVSLLDDGCLKEDSSDCI